MIILYSELPRPLKLNQFIRYAQAKIVDKMRWQNYVADCLWAQATGRTFSNKEGTTLPRWHEIINPRKGNPAVMITKDDVKAQFARLKGV